MAYVDVSFWRGRLVGSGPDRVRFMGRLRHPPDEEKLAGPILTITPIWGHERTRFLDGSLETKLPWHPFFSQAETLRMTCKNGHRIQITTDELKAQACDPTARAIRMLAA